MKKMGYLIIIFLLFISYNLNVKASQYDTSITSISVNGDLVTVVANSGVNGIRGYAVGPDKNTAKTFSTNLPNVKFSLANGNYSVWVIDGNGTWTAYGTKVIINDSCQDQTITNATGTGTYEKCFTTNGSTITPVNPGSGVVCANGYYIDAVYSIMTSEDCTIKGSNLQGLSERYCKRVYRYSCVKSQSSIISPFLSSLSISSGTLTPAFNSTTLVYAATVNTSSITISATKKEENATYVDGLGPRKVNLNYGLNKIQIKVKSSSGNIATYTLNITRQDNRSSINTLNSLTVSSGSLSPSFNYNTLNYNVSVGENISSIKIGATLTDTKSSYVSGYAPRTVTLNYGDNKFYIKVKSEAGSVRTYTLNINRAGESVNPEPPVTEPNDPEVEIPSEALLDSIKLNDGEINLDFKSDIFNYNVYIPFEVVNVVANAVSKEETDTVVVEGGTDLQVGENEIKITVTGQNGKSNIYTLYVIRKEEDLVISNDNYLKSLEVKGKKIKFDAKETDYNITLKEGEKQLDIKASPSNEKSVITIEGNENLKVGSQIKITVTAEDGSTRAYYLNITGIKKNANIFVIILIVLLIIVILGYLILRLLGYRIYFNFDMLASKFKKKKSKKKKN